MARYTLKYYKNSKGISLVEVILSFGLLALFMIPMATLMISAIWTNSISENSYEIGLQIQDIIEEEIISTNTMNYEKVKDDYVYKVNIARMNLNDFTDQGSEQNGSAQNSLGSSNIYKISVDIFKEGKLINRFISFKEI